MAMNEHVYHDVVAVQQVEDHGEWLAMAKAVAIQVSLAQGYVSSDDIWESCPPPAGADPRVMGALWRPRQHWAPIGYVPSSRKECHCRPIRQWVYVGDK
jgi:hypothetical protein